MIRVSLDVTKAVSGLNELQRTQIPFALAKTLTKTAQDAEEAVRFNVGNRFTLRNSWTYQGIRYKPALKNGARIEAQVFTRTANDSSGAPGYMERQEEGEERVPINGRHHIAVPTKYLRMLAPGAIPDELRPRNLLGLYRLGGHYVNRKGILRSATPRIRGFVFFLQQLKSGAYAIMGRYMTDRDAYPFYILITQANVRGRLTMQETVDRTVAANFDRNWAETWQEIMVRGLRVRF